MKRSTLKPKSAFRTLIQHEASGGIILMIAAATALILANSSAATAYFSVRDFPIFGSSALHWINDALMALFFLLVGAEIKREILTGELSTWQRRLLPGAAAVGGMIVPALIYLAINSDTFPQGWAIPTATDIAFALGALALLGRHVPPSLKVFLAALAILDDLGAVAIIATFYTTGLSGLWIAASFAAIGLLALINWRHVEYLSIFMIGGLVLWICIFQSGVHPTLAGVALAFLIPLRSLDRLEAVLHPWVTFLIVPIFGFANAGVSFTGANTSALIVSIPVGVAAGLFVGKQIGIFGAVWLAVKIGGAKLPKDVSYGQIYGVSLLCGIGFTMSIFIGLLAFPSSPELQDALKVGVLLGSVLSAITGMAVLYFRRS